MIGLKREIEQIARDKGIDRKVIVAALEEAMRQAARKKYGAEREIEARFNEETGEIELFEFRIVVQEVTDGEAHLELEKARHLDPDVEVGDEIGVKLDTEGFGRILAQTAKQVIIQRVRDAEREIVYEEYKDRKSEIVNGIVRRFEKGSIVVDLGRAEAVLPPKEQVPRESYRPGDRIRAFVLDVTRATKGPQIILSRGCMEMLTKLFAQEVPEMYEGIVRIESSAREPGVRSKVAVVSRDSDVDPVGACVGMKGSRVQAVVQELRGERIDIVPWSPDPARYVCSALSPAQVSKVIIDEAERSMDVIVPDDQLSLAIGRKGQNVRLAVQLTGWRHHLAGGPEPVSLRSALLPAGHRRSRRRVHQGAGRGARRAEAPRGGGGARRGGASRGGASRGGAACARSPVNRRERGGRGWSRGRVRARGVCAGRRRSGVPGGAGLVGFHGERSASEIGGVQLRTRKERWQRPGPTRSPRNSASAAASWSRRPSRWGSTCAAPWLPSTRSRPTCCARSWEATRRGRRWSSVAWRRRAARP
jgi:N utilization substance protein A